ncbi:MAG: DUF429 domain-containing protein [Gammaproteobacteria bacterium]|nr:DUF429 domain-containing protein [Gammaproteobacteria bacterium]
MRLIGIDLSWKTENNPSALAVGRMVDGTLQVEHIETGLQSVESILTAIRSRDEVIGIAIDAPLIIENHNGQRACEKAVGRDYGGRKASCHTSNKSRYPDSLSVHLSSLLQKSGFQHLNGDQWQIECYPHPAIIECFGLSERLAYKKGRVCEKKSGQAKLAKLIGFLEYSKILPLKLLGNLKVSFSDSEINELQGKELKRNEDALDSVICLYIAGLYHEKIASTLYGDSIHGYIWIPQIKCI